MAVVPKQKRDEFEKVRHIDLLTMIKWIRFNGFAVMRKEAYEQRRKESFDAGKREGTQEAQDYYRSKRRRRQ